MAQAFSEQESLSQLRDIHVPEQVSWFPPAVGWWVLLVVVLLVVAWLISFMTKRRKKTQQGQLMMQSALDEYAELSSTYQQSESSADFFGQLSALLKRVAMYHGEPVSTLTGEDWARYLQQTGFDTEQSRLIALMPYAPVTNSSDTANQIHQVLRQVNEQKWQDRQERLNDSVEIWIQERFEQPAAND